MRKRVFPKRTPHQQAELDIMGWLNQNNLYGAYGANEYYNIPGLGTLHIFWRRNRWETEWITIQEAPDGVLSALE